MATTAVLENAGGRRRWIALGVVCLAMLMNTLDGSVVNVALPTIQSDLNFSQSNLSWVVNAYLITFGSFLLLSGRLGDLIGRKKVFLSGVAIFTAASAVCGLADSQGLLIAARFAQGLGGAVSSSVIIALIITEFPQPAERARAMSAYIFVAVGGGSLGLLVGGFLTQTVSWHWIFFVNIPIGIVTLVLGSMLLEESGGLGIDRSLDVLGSFLVTGALMVGIYGIVKATEYGWLSSHTYEFVGLAVLMLVAFFVLESRISNPILPLRVFRIPGLMGTSAVRGLVSAGMWATFFLGALFLERVKGFGALDTGLAFMPMTIAVGALSLGIVAKLVSRFGPVRVMLPGLAGVAIALLLLATTGEHTSYFPRIFITFLIFGLGAGSSFVPLLTIAMARVPKADAGVASGVVNVSMQISAAIGLAVLATISTDHAKTLSDRGHTLKSSLTGGYQLAFWVALGCVLVGIVLALLILRNPDQSVPVEIDREIEASVEALVEV